MYPSNSIDVNAVIYVELKTLVAADSYGCSGSHKSLDNHVIFSLILLVFRVMTHFILAKRPMKTEQRRKNRTCMRGNRGVRDISGSQRVSPMLT